MVKICYGDDVARAMFPSTYFYAHFGIDITLDGNAKMQINSKNARKNVCAHRSRIHFLPGKKTGA